MRLIDADVLQEHFTDMQNYEECACNFESGNAACTEWYCVEQALENAPTIDAIPVEWLWKKREVAIWQFAGAIDWLLSDWQQEQEAQDG